VKPKGKFIFVDDDKDEHPMFIRSLRQLCDNEVISAFNGEEALQVIKENKDDIFLIICDINMPKINGLELKRVIEGTPELKIKAIPFIFHTTHATDLVIKEAYSLGIQGFIQKSNDLSKSVSNLDIIVKFWSTIVHPNSAT
jgi:CheY-like chemotaxis protein